jgi:hypothetical protein
VGFDNSAQILVIVLVIFLSLFLVLAVILLIMLLRITQQIKKITDIAGSAAEQLNGVFGPLKKLAVPAVASTVVKYIFKQAKKSIKKHSDNRKNEK